MPLPGKTSKMNPKGKLDKSKEESSRLEEENRLMEVRLQELKLAMDKEKKARSVQNQGGGFWQSAQENKQPTGPVNHPPEVLKKNMRQYEKPRARVRKVKVLKDEPLMLPSRPPAVTDDIKRIMTKELPRDSKETSPKAKKCGQCEMKAAAVICQDCGENYCPGCFASFHLKGALKKHRSIPIQAALGARQSPRMPFLPKPPPVSYHEKEEKKVVEKPAVVEPAAKVHFDGPSLLDGNFDEQANAAEFAAALAEWRSGNGAGDVETSNDSSPKSSKSSDSVADPSAKTVTFADQGTQSPRYTLDVKGTSTDEGSGKPVKIEFHQSEMSYAEKLLLRKHRRDPVEAIPVNSPRSSESIRAVESSSEESLPDRSESVDFESLYHIAVPSPRPDSWLSQTSVTSQIEVVEVTSMTDVSSMEQATCYQVEEEPGCIEFVNQKNAKNDAKNGRDSKTPASKTKKAKQEPDVRKSSAKSEKSPVKSSRDSKIERKTPDLRKTWEKEPSLSMEKIPKVEVKKPPIPEAKKNPKEAKSKEGLKRESVDLTLDLQKEKSTVKKTSASPRPKSRSAATPRSARPNSRQARAALKEALGEGVLTKKPSSALSAVAQRQSTDSENQYRGLGDILTLGVRPVQQDRILVARTPRSARGEKRPQSSVSYKLYSMGPKSWRPDSALGDAVAHDQVTGHDFNLALVDPGAEVDDDINEEIKALDVIGGLRLNFSANQDEPDLTNQSNERLTRSSTHVGVDQSQDLMHLRASVQSDSSCEEALQRLAEAETPREKSDVTAGRESRMIVVDGDDMTEYDQDKYLDAPGLNGPGQDDNNTLDQLEWELASMTGRITAEGKVSRLSLHSSQDSAVSSPGSSAISSPLDSAREIEMAVRSDGLGFDDLETQIADELDVRALK